MKSFETLKSLEHDNVMQTYGRFDLALDHGQGALLYDLDGKEYIDLTSGIGVNALGHNHPKLVKAITDQAGKMIQASNLFYTQPMIDAAVKLNELAGTEKVFFSNSGAEANEGLIKIARKYSWDKYQDPNRLTILSMKNSFHVRTIATLEATGQDKFHANFFPFTQVNLFYTQPMIDAAVKLNELAGTEKVFFSNSGAEANEGLIKIARKYSWDKYQDPNRLTILSLKNSFHGRTIATLDATGQDKFHANFFPFTQGFDYVEANNIEDLQEKMKDPTVCAIMMELVQGESGVRPLDPAFVQEAARLCAENDILLGIDEVQTGVGRTGTFFAYQQYGIQPDLVSTAKGLGGGVPMGAVLAGEKTANVLGAGDHGTTFGGNPLASSAANVILDEVGDPEFLNEVAKKGESFMEQIRALNSEDVLDVRGLLASSAANVILDEVGDPEFLNEVAKKGESFMEQIRALNSEDVLDVRGLGLMIGIEVGPEKVGDLLTKLREKGVLALKAGTGTIRLLPPLVITDEQIAQAIEAMKGVFA